MGPRSGVARALLGGARAGAGAVGEAGAAAAAGTGFGLAAAEAAGVEAEAVEEGLILGSVSENHKKDKFTEINM